MNITVAKIITERTIPAEDIQRELSQVAMDSVACPRAVTDSSGRLKFIFMYGRCYEIKESKFAAIRDYLHGQTLAGALDMFTDKGGIKEEIEA